MTGYDRWKTRVIKSADLDWRAEYDPRRSIKRDMSRRMPWTREARELWRREFDYMPWEASEELRRGLEAGLGAYRYKVTSEDVRGFIARYRGSDDQPDLFDGAGASAQEVHQEKIYFS